MSLLGTPNEIQTTNSPEMVLELDAVTKDLSIGSVYTFVRERFEEAKRERRPQELIWLDAVRAWKREYSPEEKQRIAQTEARNPGASRHFIGITKTKVQSAYSQILDILLSGNKFPISIEPTPCPSGIADSVYLTPENSPSVGTPNVGYMGDGQQLPPGSTQKSLLGGYAAKVDSFLGGEKVNNGPSPDKAHLPELHPAEDTAWEMEKLIQDQLTEDAAEYALRRTIFECVLLGSGVFKGPTGKDKLFHHWKQDPKTNKITYDPTVKFVPKFDSVSCWNFYPDPHASHAKDWDYTIERHLLNRAQLRELKANPTFIPEAIERLLKLPPIYTEEYWETQIRETNLELNRKRYEVLEYWGYLDEALAQSVGLKFEINQINMVNIWICHNEIIRAIVNPFSPQRFPYYVVPYEEHPYQVWGIGVGENMKDTQSLMNGHMRLAIDNLKLAGSVILEVNQNQLAPGQDMTIYPGKMFFRQGGSPNQSIYSIDFKDTSASHMAMFDKARQLSDETTGIPSFATGSGEISSAMRNAASISMMMGAAALNIKTVIRNIDYYLLQPLGEQIYQWNMQFNEDDVKIRGDMEVKAQGTTALMQREVQSQRLLSLVQVASNPIMAPFLNAEYAFKEIAKSMDLDPDKIVNSPDIAALYAQTIQLAGGIPNANQPQSGTGSSSPSQAGGQGSPQQNTGGVNPSDDTGRGGGNIGVGSNPQPGNASFSANRG